MTTATPTKFNRLKTGEMDGVNEAFGDVVLSQRVTIATANTAASPAKMRIKGQVQTTQVIESHGTAIATGSGAGVTIYVGTSADVSALHEFSVSAGSANDYASVTTAATGRSAEWRSLGSAEAVTTVQVYYALGTAASATNAMNAQVTLNYIVRG